MSKQHQTLMIRQVVLQQVEQVVLQQVEVEI